MNRITTIIVEDEEGPLVLLKKKIESHCPQLEIIGESKTVNHALELIQSYKPDLLFLDIQLKEKTGFDLIKKLRYLIPKIIFVTAFDKYALKAFQFNALHFILKPVDTEDLTEAVDRMIQAKLSEVHYQMAMHNYLDNKWEKIAIPSVSKIEYIELQNLVKLESDGSYTILHLENDETITSTKPLKEYEKLLEKHQFLRVHRSYLINLSKVSAYHKGRESDKIVLTNNTNIEVSRKKRNSIIEAIDTYHLSGKTP